MKGLKCVALFITGVATGAAGMWFGVKKHYEKKAEKEVADARKAFHSLMKRKRANQDSSKEEEAESSDSASDSSSDVVKGIKEELVQRMEDEKSYLDILEDLGYDPASNADLPLPYEIEAIEFDRTRYRQVYLFWFSNDRCLCNANTGRVYPEVEDLIGNVGMERVIESCSEDNEDKFYIRNDAFGIDFCVQLEHTEDYYDIFGDGSEG